MTAIASRLFCGFARLRTLAPGVALCVAVGSAALALEAGERTLFGKAWLEPMVLAILMGAAVRSVWNPGPDWEPGVAWSARFLLELGVALLGVSVSAATLLATGPGMIAGVAAVVALAIVLSFGICRLLRLPVRMALLIACGNSICGNSAIAAVAPVIDADSNDVAASIAFTAVLGVLVVLGLPLLGLWLGMGAVGYGALTGLTVYAVPQVLAAAAPFGTTAMHMGALVKLVRVLMLGPICLVLSLFAPRLAPRPAAGGRSAPRRQPGVMHALPWFIAAFMVLAALRSAGLVPQALVAPASEAASILTLLSMAALGLGVDVRMVARSGWRVVAAAVLSILALTAISLALLLLLGMV
ncbi:YeiH family protein [Camelimonas sp. ID_303_24]